MRNQFGGLSVAVLAVLLLATSVAAQDDLERAAMRYVELPNFHRVNESLYRGAQPRPGGIRKLAELGIKTIINLRADDEHALAEEAEARAAGLRYFNVPLAVYAKPTDEQVERALAIIDGPENWPVFVHCRRGADRTGTIFAAYRISHQGWTSKQAKREADYYGMRRVQFEMRDYITDYYRRRIGLDEHGDFGTDITSSAAASTRRTLGKTYAFARLKVKQLRNALP